MNIKVINFVNKLKNSSLVNRKIVIFLYSQLIHDYVNCLYREGFIQSYQVVEFDNIKKINVFTKIVNGKVLTSDIVAVSSVTKQRYLTANEVHGLNIKKGEFFLSTSEGIYSLSECKKMNIGGVVAFAC